VIAVCAPARAGDSTVEHALSLEFRDGAIVAANDSQFRLEAGVLRWMD
jgi:hypothetical protein